jgi:hypothetical protein
MAIVYLPWLKSIYRHHQTPAKSFANPLPAVQIGKAARFQYSVDAIKICFPLPTVEDQAV